MFSSADKTTKSSPAVKQKAVGTSFFRKAGEETFFAPGIQTKSYPEKQGPGLFIHRKPGVSVTFIDVDDIPADRRNPNVNVPKQPSMFSEVDVYNLDSHTTEKSTYSKMRFAPNYVDNLVTSVGAEQYDFWTLEVKTVKFLAKGGKTFTLPKEGLNYSGPNVSKFVVVQGIIYPIATGNGSPYNQSNTPNIVAGFRDIDDRVQYARQERLFYAQLVFTFAMTLAQYVVATSGESSGEMDLGRSRPLTVGKRPGGGFKPPAAGKPPVPAAAEAQAAKLPSPVAAEAQVVKPAVPAAPTLKPPVPSTTLMQAGSTLDRGGLTTAGRALQKHGGRLGSAFPKTSGTPAAINAQGETALRSIVENPNATRVIRHHARFGEVLEVKIPSGAGARFSSDGSKFIGFIEP
jgi:hypothetical protein